MELELGLKITKTKDDIDSISEYQFMKDAGPVFHSRETNTMFILTANLKGYKRNNIDIKISKDGNKISIIGKKPIQEMVMMGWVMQRKVVDVKGFNKVFKIPHGVNLDKIKASYNEEEWMMNIVMPKLVKGIYGLKIEEFKEQEKSEIDHVSSSVGETSHKGSKDCEFQHMEGSENAIEKMLDDTKKKVNKEIITQEEVKASKLRIEDGNDEVNRNIRENEKCKLRIEDSKIKDIRENDGKETCEALKTLGDMEKMLNETNKDINEETIEKEVGDSKLRIENGNRESARDKGGKEEYDVTKKLERDQGVDVFISNKFEDMGKDKEFEDQKMDNGSANKWHDDVNRDIIGRTIKEEEKEESNLRSEDSKVEDIGKGVSHNITETSQRVFEECMIQQSGESKQKESKAYYEETEKENSMESFEATKVLEVEQNVVGHIPSNIGCINQNEFEESRIPQMEKTITTKGKMNTGEYEKLPFKGNQDFQNKMIKPKMETKNGDQECGLEKLGGKERFDGGMVIIKKEFPKNLFNSTSKEREGLNVEKMQETKFVNGEMVSKEVECFMEKGEGERIERMHVEEKKGNNTREKIQEEIEESGKGIKESVQEQFVGIEGSKRFSFENKDEENGVIKEALVENESLIVRGVEYKERTKEINQDVEDTIEYGIVKLKGEESIKISENGPKESGHEKFARIKESKGLNFVNEEEENEVINDALVEDESLIKEGGEYKDKTKEIINEEDKNKHGIIELKVDGSTKSHGEPNESFEGDNVNNGKFDGRKIQKFQEIEQTKDEGANEKGVNIEKYMKKMIREKNEKVQNEENEGFRKNIPKEKDECFLEEGMSKERSKASNVVKEGFPTKMLDSPVDTREGLKNTRIDKIKGINESVKESSMGPFGAMKVSKLEPFKVNDEVHKDFINPKTETKDEKQNEEFHKNLPKRTHEETEGLNVLKMQETKDVKRKVKEIEYFKAKDEGDILKRTNVEEKKVQNKREIMQEEIEKSENGIKGDGQQEVAEIEGIKGFNVVKEEEEESKERSKEIEQDEEGVSHNIVDSSQRVFEESLTQPSEELKEKKIGGSMCDSKESLKEVLKENIMEQSLNEHIHHNIGNIDQNEFREPRLPQMKKSKSTKGEMNGGRESENTPFEVIDEDVQKTMFGDTIPLEVIKINEEFPKDLRKSNFDESDGLNVQKIQESINVKEEMVDKEIGYFEEKGEGERFKRIHVKIKKGNTKETMQEENEKNENEFKERDRQHAKENTIKEMDEDSNNVTGELKHKVTEIDESKGFNIAKEEEQKEVTRKALVESESLMEKMEGKESKERINAKRVYDEDDEIEFGIVKLKGKRPIKIHDDGRKFQDKGESKDLNEKGEKIEKFGKVVNKRIQKEENEDFKKGVKKGKYESNLSDDVSESRSQDTKDAKEELKMKMLDSQFDTRENLKDTKIEKTKGLEENEKVVPFVKKVKFEEEEEEEEEEEFKERTNAIVQDEEDKIEYGIVKLKGEGLTKITHKFQEKEKNEDVNEKGEKTGKFVKKVNEKIQNEKDKGFNKNTKIERDECLLQEEISEGRSKASEVANESFEDRIKKENRNKKLDHVYELVQKENVGAGIVDGRKIKKFQEMNQTQDVKKKGANSEKILKKMSGNKEVSEKVEQVEANEGMRNDIGEQNFGESMTKEEFQEFEVERIRNPEREIQSVVSMGFKEFDYKNAKDKKQMTKVLDTKFKSKGRYESHDESMNQEVFSPKKPKEVGENCTRNKVEEFETIEDQVTNQISVPRFQSEKDVEKIREIIHEKMDESEKKIDDREQENVARDDGKAETKEKYMFKEYNPTQNVDDEKCNIDGEIENSGIGKVHKKKWIHETMKIRREKECSVKFEVDEKEEESLDERLKNDIAETKTNRDNEQHEYGAKEIKAPETMVYEEAKLSKLQRKRVNQQTKDEINKNSECVTEEHETTKEFSPKNVDKGKVVKEREGLKVVYSEETKDDSTLTTPQTTEEKKPKMKGNTSQFDKASGSKNVAKKVHETLKREHQRKSQESTSKMEVEPPTIIERKKAHELTRSPNMNNEIPKVEELQEENEEGRRIHVPEATISKEGTQVTSTHFIENNTSLEVVADKEAQQFEVEGKAKPKKKESKMDMQHSTKSKTSQVVEQCINKYEEPKHGIEEEKEGKDETNGGKKENAKISKTIEEEKILKKREEPKVAKSDEEKKPKMKETTTPQLDLASGFKRVVEKVHETRRKSEESTYKFEVEPLNMDDEFSKVEELKKEEVQKKNHVLEATISKEDATQGKVTHAKEKVVQQSKVSSSLCTQQLEVEGKEKIKKNELEQCIKKEENAKLGIEEIEEEEKDYDKVHEEEKEDKDEGKKDNVKISKKLFVPLVIAGSAVLATIVYIFVKNRRSRKM
ncbi:unnamed protein product [Lathyrus oleraceus]